MNGNYTIAIFFVCFWIFGFGFLTGGKLAQEESEKLAIELKHYPKCETVKRPIYCVMQYKKIKDVEMQVDNVR